VALIFFIIAIYQLAFNGQANIYPMNFSLLFVFVLATSYITGYIACKSDTDDFLQCMIGAGLIIMVITIYANITTRFSNWMPLLSVVSLIASGLMIIYCVKEEEEDAHPKLKLVFLFLYSLFLLFDTNMILKGKNTFIIDIG